jgi:preprotein translocase subunit YajC
MAALLPILLLVVLMYFLLIRPQQRRMKEQQALLAAVAEGDEVLTSSGMYGFITAMEGDVIWVEIAEGVEIRVAKGAIARRVAPSADTGTAEPAATDDDVAGENEADGGSGSTGGDSATRGSDDES